MNADFTAGPSESAGVRPPFEDFPTGVELALVRSQPVTQDLGRLAWLPRSIRYAPSQYRRRCIDLHGSFEEYIKKFSSKSRHNRRQEVRTLAAASGGEVAFREFRHSHDMTDFLRLARAVARTTYQEKVLQLAIPETEAFLEELTHLAMQDSVRGYVLFLEKQPIAFLLSIARHHRLGSTYVGYDPRFARFSPGTVVLYLALEHIFSEKKFVVFDFGEGDAPYKEYFSTTSILCADVYYFRRTLRNAAIVVAHCGLLIFSEATGRALAALRLKTRMKRSLRWIVSRAADASAAIGGARHPFFR